LVDLLEEQTSRKLEASTTVYHYNDLLFANAALNPIVRAIIFKDWRLFRILRIEPIGCGEGMVGGMIVVGCGMRARVGICSGRVLGGLRDEELVRGWWATLSTVMAGVGNQAVGESRKLCRCEREEDDKIGWSS